MKINIEFKNYKLLKDKKATLDGCNVYLVHGANEQGKTSFINGLLTMLHAENKTKQPVTLGEKNGQIALDMQTNDGKDFKMLFEFTDQKNKFTLISDNKLLSKVTDIRSFLNYQTLTADEFISWSNTAEGRRKQRDIVLDLLGADVKQKFIELTSKEKQLYEERAGINSEVKGFEAVINRLGKPTLTPEEEKEINSISTYQDEIASLEIKRQDFLDYNKKIYPLNLGWQKIKDTCKDLTVLYGDNKNKPEVQDIQTINEIANKNILSQKDTDNFFADANVLRNKITLATARLRQINAYKEHEAMLNEKLEEAEKLNNEIEKLRKEKTTLTSNANLPIDDIAIDDDGIWIKTKDGLLPFDINQVSTSRIMLIVAKIMLMLNKHLPIVIMGRGEAFDSSKLNELSKFAEANNCLLIIDKVTDSQGIEIVGYEDVN